MGGSRDQTDSTSPSSTLTSTPQVPHWKQPSHPDMITVITPPSSSPESFSSYAIVSRPFPANTVITPITNTTPASPAYSTVQISETQYIELNSDLLYSNHSCNPNVVFDMDKMEVRSVKEIEAGEMLTFFYPSSEWDMKQGFKCECGSKERCLGWIRGAKYLDDKVLEGYWLNPHIRRMVEKRKVDGEEVLRN